jgi:hypothetical protein
MRTASLAPHRWKSGRSLQSSCLILKESIDASAISDSIDLHGNLRKHSKVHVQDVLQEEEKEEGNTRYGQAAIPMPTVLSRHAPKAPPLQQHMLEELVEALVTSKRCLVVTGAGCR